MSLEIKKLDEITINRIAAGEIIQRPSNIIKEMIENSLDAKSTIITIICKNGGIDYIQIQDNGIGIKKESLNIVCERFTTSKINSYNDLKTVITYGFRGEALASISHVSHVTIITKTNNQQCAYKAKYLDGILIPFKVGENPSPKPCAGIVGTTITVEDLFYNMLPRRQALRNYNDEYQRILDVITKYSIHFGDKKISFTCKKLGSQTPDLHTPQQSSTLDNIKLTYGPQITRELLPFNITHGIIISPNNDNSNSNNEINDNLSNLSQIQEQLSNDRYEVPIFANYTSNISTNLNNNNKSDNNSSIESQYIIDGINDINTTTSTTTTTNNNNNNNNNENISQPLQFILDGYVTNANYSCKKSICIIFINNRLVECNSIKKTIEAVYSNYLPRHTHPFLYLAIRMPCEYVDVNVHPTKKEVIFLHEEEILGVIHNAITSLLSGANNSRVFYTQTILSKLSQTIEIPSSSSSTTTTLVTKNDNDELVSSQRKRQKVDLKNPVELDNKKKSDLIFDLNDENYDSQIDYDKKQVQYQNEIQKIVSIIEGDIIIDTTHDENDEIDDKIDDIGKKVDNVDSISNNNNNNSNNNIENNIENKNDNNNMEKQIKEQSIVQLFDNNVKVNKRTKIQSNNLNDINNDNHEDMFNFLKDTSNKNITPKRKIHASNLVRTETNNSFIDQYFPTKSLLSTKKDQNNQENNKISKLNDDFKQTNDLNPSDQDNDFSMTDVEQLSTTPPFKRQLPLYCFECTSNNNNNNNNINGNNIINNNIDNSDIMNLENDDSFDSNSDNNKFNPKNCVCCKKKIENYSSLISSSLSSSISNLEYEINSNSKNNNTTTTNTTTNTTNTTTTTTMNTTNIKRKFIEYPRTNCSYISIKNLIKKIDDETSNSIKDLVKKFILVGILNSTFLIGQYETKLYLIDYSYLLLHLFYQLTITRFQILPSLSLSLNPVPVEEYILCALDLPQADWKIQDGPKDQLAKAMTSLLISKSDMLTEYFKITITSNGQLISLPNLLDDYTPLPEALPLFLLRLASETNWEVEEDCFTNIAKEIALFYSQLQLQLQLNTNVNTNVNKNKNNSNYLSKDIELKIINHLLPAIKFYLIPSRHFIEGGVFVQIADLKNLYKIFERC